MMGFTSEIAWGLTTGFVDCYDLFIEEINEDNYLTQSGWKPLETRTETIDVKGKSSHKIKIKKTHQTTNKKQYLCINTCKNNVVGKSNNNRNLHI